MGTRPNYENQDRGANELEYRYMERHNRRELIHYLEIPQRRSMGRFEAGRKHYFM